MSFSKAVAVLLVILYWTTLFWYTATMSRLSLDGKVIMSRSCLNSLMKSPITIYITSAEYLSFGNVFWELRIAETIDHYYGIIKIILFYKTFLLQNCHAKSEGLGWKTKIPYYHNILSTDWLVTIFCVYKNQFSQIRQVIQSCY